MENNIIEEKNDNKPFSIVLIMVIIIVIGGGICLLLNHEANIEEQKAPNETIVEDNETVEEENNTEIEENETIERLEEGDFDNIIEENEEDAPNKNLLTKTDKDYVYTYYKDDEEESQNEVTSFKINNIEVIDDIGFTSEIKEVKKYKNFLAIETLYVATCGPDHNDLFIFDYKGNLLFKSGSISIEDLERIKNTDTDDKWNTGYMTYDKYTYDENNKTLEVSYLFNINAVLGDCVGENKTFCLATKNKTLYSNIKLSLKYNNGKLENETVVDKTELKIDNFNEEDKSLIDSYCN